jgi:hypothetical protein
MSCVSANRETCPFHKRGKADSHGVQTLEVTAGRFSLAKMKRRPAHYKATRSCIKGMREFSAVNIIFL